MSRYGRKRKKRQKNKNPIINNAEKKLVHKCSACGQSQLYFDAKDGRGSHGPHCGICGTQLTKWDVIDRIETPRCYNKDCAPHCLLERNQAFEIEERPIAEFFELPEIKYAMHTGSPITHCINCSKKITLVDTSNNKLPLGHGDGPMCIQCVANLLR